MADDRDAGPIAKGPYPAHVCPDARLARRVCQRPPRPMWRRGCSGPGQRCLGFGEPEVWPNLRGPGRLRRGVSQTALESARRVFARLVFARPVKVSGLSGASPSIEFSGGPNRDYCPRGTPEFCLIRGLPVSCLPAVQLIGACAFLRQPRHARPDWTRDKSGKKQAGH